VLALAQLKHVLGEHRKLQCKLGLLSLQLAQVMFLQLVNRDPHRLKRATVHNEGVLENTDLAVQAHSALVVDASSKTLIIDQSPAMLLEGSPNEVPMIFSPGQMPLKTLLKTRLRGGPNAL
jgi:hypothetical protein